MKNTIDLDFDFRLDSNGKDPDIHSPSLKQYHYLFWRKNLPNGALFNINPCNTPSYLSFNSFGGIMELGSDAIAHSYKNQKRKAWIVEQIPEQVDSLFDAACKMQGYLIFPNKKIDGKHTINQCRGINKYIDDRFDLTLECIRRYYLNVSSPLFETLHRYKAFFDLFDDFHGYVDFFLLQDLIHSKTGEIKFYLPFDEFQSTSKFNSIGDYQNYKENVLEFLSARSKRMHDYVSKIGLGK